MNINNINDERKSIRIGRSLLFFLFFLAFIFYPTSLMPGGIRSGIALFSLFFIALTLLSKEFRLIPSDFLFLLCSLAIFLSVAVSPNATSFNDILEFLRPIFYLSIILFCRHYGRKLNLDLFSKVLMFFIIIEFSVAVLQRLNVDFFVQVLGLIWNIEGNWKYRNTGTFSNPNILGGFLIFAWVGYALFNRGRFITEFILTAMVLFSIILAGSKTSIILLIAAIYFVYFLKYNIIRYSFVSIVVVPFALLIAYLWVSNNAAENVYIAQILKILEPGGLENIKSYSDRENIWLTVINNYDGGGLVRWLVGYGPDKSGFLRSVDHEYIGIYYRYGVIGAITLYASIFFLVTRLHFYRNFTKEIKEIYHAVLVLLVLLFIAGFVMESFSAWIYPFMFFIYIGIGLAKIDVHKKASSSI